MAVGWGEETKWGQKHKYKNKHKSSLCCWVDFFHLSVRLINCTICLCHSDAFETSQTAPPPQSKLECYWMIVEFFCLTRVMWISLGNTECTLIIILIIKWIWILGSRWGPELELKDYSTCRAGCGKPCPSSSQIHQMPSWTILNSF